MKNINACFPSGNFFRLFLLLLWVTMFSCEPRKDSESGITASSMPYREPHRPQYHFSPDSMWMNDPNGMVFHDGEYHLFYQYYPDSTVWGPMHWGHAVSRDLIHWQHMPIALYPDILGYIFSGSAVFDVGNTSELGTEENPPLVAIFTYHDAEGEKAGKIDYQTQGIAYSLDKGRSWTKYEFNPILSNPGIADFRDPKVMWHEPTQQWIMTLAVKNHINFYSSPNLLEWNFESEFGRDLGAHGGVWECPDLFPLTDGQETDNSDWVLLVSINPGGPVGGSATQYFIGEFDGQSFIPADTLTRWIDFGADNYAGVTYSNVDSRRIFMGWMSNWMYAQVVPTHPWRSAMTLPRELSMAEVEGVKYVKSSVVEEFDNIVRTENVFQGDQLNQKLSITDDLNFDQPVFMSEFEAPADESWKVELSNDLEERIMIAYHVETDSFYVDRSVSGKDKFHEGFFKKHSAPRISNSKVIKIKMLFDVASLELFADDGLTVMTEIFFPSRPYQYISFEGVDSVKIASVKSIW